MVGWASTSGPKTIELFSQEISKARTIVWNGPLGMFEKPAFAQGTLAMARAVAAATEAGATSIIGGGDSVAAAEQSGVAKQISHISTGGGASLEFLAGEKLPGVEALTDKPKLTKEIRLRRPVIAGNWKMYKTQAETRAFFEAFQPLVALRNIATSSWRRRSPRSRPPSRPRADRHRDRRAERALGARRCLHRRNLGAHAGRGGCRAVIIGHSERRQYFGETDETGESQDEGRAGSRAYADRLRGRNA